jgi:hypothetical protein
VWELPRPPANRDGRRVGVVGGLPPENFDVVFCIGLLEGVEPLESFLARLRDAYPSLVVSYTFFDVPRPLTSKERRCSPATA